MRTTARQTSLLGPIGVIAALSLLIAGCGGSSNNPGGAGGSTATGGSTVGGTGGLAGTGGGPGATGGAAATGGSSATGGAAATGGASATGGATATGGAGLDAGVDRGSDTPSGSGGSTPSLPDALPFDLSLPDGFSLDGATLGDGGPPLTICPFDTTNATCSTGLVCFKVTPPFDGCVCTNAQRWLCPGLGPTDAGLGPVSDGGLPDLGIGTCPSGTVSGGVCTTEGTLCTGVGTLGCACFRSFAGLAWLCQ